MKTTTELLNAVKAKNGITTDYALAKALDLPRARVCNFYKGTRSPNEHACLQIAKALGMRYEEVSAIVRIEAESDEKKRADWKDYYKSIGGIAASVALMVFTSCILIVTPTPAEASTLQALNPHHFVLCLVAMIFAYSNRQLQLRKVRLKPQLCMSIF